MAKIRRRRRKKNIGGGTLKERLKEKHDERMKMKSKMSGELRRIHGVRPDGMICVSGADDMFIPVELAEMLNII